MATGQDGESKLRTCKWQGVPQRTYGVQANVAGLPPRTVVVVAILAPSAFLVTMLAVPILMRYLRAAGITGKDLHKADRPAIAEMGGLAIVFGFVVGVLLAVGMLSFLRWFRDVDLAALLASLSAILMAGLIGLLDDLFDIQQGVKAVLPVLAAVPLMAIRAGDTAMTLPVLGPIDVWIFYPLLIIPSAFTVAANAVNMLAGFNGLEIGLGVVSIGSLSIIAWQLGETSALVLLLSGLGALLAMIPFNWFPAKVFVGDVGTLTIGAIIAAAVIIGDFEVAGMILLLPYGIDFAFKAAHRFPSSGWGGVLLSLIHI